MKFGVMQAVLGKDTDSVFGVAAKLGFGGVELDWRKADDARGANGDFRAARRLAIRRRAQNAGLVVSSVCAGWCNQGGLAEPNLESRQRAVVALSEGIKLCAELGAETLLVPFFGAGMIRDEQTLAWVTHHLQWLAADAQASNVKLGVETTLPAAKVKAMLEQIASPGAGCYWDMGNAMWLGHDPLAEIRTLGTHIVAVHAKEFLGAPTPDPAKVSDGLNAAPLGEGMVPVREVIATLREVGYDGSARAGWITLETGAFGGDRFASAQKALMVLRAAASD